MFHARARLLPVLPGWPRRTRRTLVLLVLGLCSAAGVALAQGTAAPTPEAEAVRRGETVFRAAGGCGCHTDYKHDGATMAGGRGLATPFGTYYSTNITPDAETGLGRWSDADFIRAMREGVGPQGQTYFPVFPYTSFTGMSDADLLDLKAYLFSLPAVRQPNRAHDVWPPFGWRLSLLPWRWLFFQPARFTPDAARSARWNRGAYLAQAVAHCGECHTPRNLMGALRSDRQYAGSVEGPEGELAPNITPHEATGIGEWSEADLAWFLETGFKPDGDDAQGLMGQVIEHGYAKLSKDDRAALVDYVRSVAPLDNKVQAPPKPE